MIQIGRAEKIETPIEHLMACHRRIEDRLATLERAGERLEAQPEEALAAIQSAIRFLDSNGAMHTTDEELSVFPRLRGRVTPEESAYIEDLERQHRAADEVYAGLKQALEQRDQEAFAKLATRLGRLYRDHIRSEDEVLTRMALRTLSEADLEEIRREMRQRRDRSVTDPR